MAVFVSFFRGINVGGHNLVKMSTLKEMHEAIGLNKVTTLLQSGNVVFDTDETDSDKLAKQIAKEFEKKFGFNSEVIVRSSADLKDILKKNPFHGHGDKETKWIAVIFLSDAPTKEAQDDLTSSYSGPEEIIIKDKEMYVYYSEGMGRSKLTNILIEKKLKVRGTARNWNTVSKLLEMTKD